ALIDFVYALGLYPGNMYVKVQADPRIGLPHGGGDLPGNFLPLAQGKYGGPRSGYATTQGTGRKGVGLNGIKAGNKDGTNGFHDHIVEGTTDQVVILSRKPCDQSPEVPPLLYALFHGDGGLQYFPGIGSLDFQLGMDDRGV